MLTQTLATLSVTDVVSLIFRVYFYTIFIYILLSWVPSLHGSRFYEFFRNIAEPYLRLFRKIIPPIGMIDISPIVAILALQLIEGWLILPIVRAIFG